MRRKEGSADLQGRSFNLSFRTRVQNRPESGSEPTRHSVPKTSMARGRGPSIRPFATLLLLIALNFHASALTITPTDEVDDSITDSASTRTRSAIKKPGLRTSVLYAQTAVAYAGATAVLMPIVEPQHLAALLPKASGFLTFWSALAALRDQYLFGFLCAHEVINDLASDVLAQAVTIDRKKTIPREERRVSLDWRRVMRSMSSAMISDDLPFLAWSKILWSLSEMAAAKLRASSSLPVRLVSALTHPLGMATAKMFITQLVYEPVSSGAYLAIQALLKGQGWKGVRKELKEKLWTAWTDGLIYWSFAHMAVFLMPFWWLQPIADNVATLFFNSYLSLLSNGGLENDGEESLVEAEGADAKAH